MGGSAPWLAVVARSAFDEPQIATERPLLGGAADVVTRTVVSSVRLARKVE